MSIWNYFSYDLGIDLGTSNTLVFIKGQGIMVREPSVVARQKKQTSQGKNIGKIIAVGSEAKRMLGKTPDTIEAVRPLKDGVISDFDATEAMIRYYIQQIHQRRGLLPKIPHPKVVIGIPTGVTEVERRAVQQAALVAGARKAYLIEEPMAAAIGAKIPILEPQGQLIIDIGGGTTEVSVLSLGGVVVERSLRIAGDEFDEAIVNFMKKKYQLVIGELTAEEMKLQIGSAFPLKQEKQFVVRGRNMAMGLPQSIKIDSKELREALLPILKQIITETKDLLEETPAELVSDIVKNGIVLAGGGALLSGIDQAIFKSLKIPVWIADDPLTCVVRGCGELLDNEELLQKVKVVGGLR